MVYFIGLITYIVLISWLAWYINKPKPDVIKKKGKYLYNKNFKKGDTVKIPMDAFLNWQQDAESVYFKPKE